VIEIFKRKCRTHADLGASGWQYITKYDPNIKDWTVQPNDIMAAGIIPGTFKMPAKQFYKYKRKFYLMTFYTNTAGSDRVVEETLVHE